MKLTRRGLFAAIAAAVAVKPAVDGLPLALVRSFDRQMIQCQCPGCQYARGVLSRTPTYEWYPDAFAAPAPNQLLTMQEITHESLQILEKNIKLLPPVYFES